MRPSRLRDQGAIAIRLISVRAGALPLPVLQLADELAEACKKLKVPVHWTTQNGQPVALVEIQTPEPMYVDDVQLDENQLYVAGHTGNGSQQIRCVGFTWSTTRWRMRREPQRLRTTFNAAG